MSEYEKFLNGMDEELVREEEDQEQDTCAMQNKSAKVCN
ncbi:hypothetical protein J2S77_002644 [Alkalibacillus salilacus]|uniref:Uncharacterized protein n=1 Tax=Alkalibacillus salilacus TaxID=284582 RepID=A0ABT9VIG8_9BACI|nr:hypothetical protein [Alkalibacillus salilacus]